MRSDANTISTQLIGQIVAAAHDFDCDVEGAKVHVVSKATAPPKWPSSAGIPPPIVELACSWSNGSVALLFAADRWPQSGKVALKVALAKTQAQILWITLPRLIGDSADGTEVLFPASMTPIKRKSDGNIDAMSAAMKEAFARSGIPKWKTGDWRALAFTAQRSNGINGWCMASTRKTPGSSPPCSRAARCGRRHSTRASRSPSRSG